MARKASFVKINKALKRSNFKALFILVEISGIEPLTS